MTPIPTAALVSVLMASAVVALVLAAFFVDPISAMHLEGTTIDYVMGISGAGFKFNNPTAKSTCGCGSSFST